MAKRPPRRHAEGMFCTHCHVISLFSRSTQQQQDHSCRGAGHRNIGLPLKHVEKPPAYVRTSFGCGEIAGSSTPNG